MTETQRLFFALVPDADTRRAIREIQDRLPGKIGRPVRAENIHLTLAFIGSADAELADCVRARAASVGCRSFAFRLDRLGQFARSQVLWLGSGERCEPLRGLVRELNAVLEPCGYRPEHRPFAPHVTLMRKVRKRLRLPEVPIVEWPVSEFVLMRSVPGEEGVRYEPLGTFDLTQEG